ncbi:MAG: T9SS type A sorting domain-containing protein [Stygiobacter sp.]
MKSLKSKMNELFLVVLLVSNLKAQWSNDPKLNNAICTAALDQRYPTIVSDGSGGAIITWLDHRNGYDNIYAQKINSNGMIQWTTNGVAICSSASAQQEQTIVSDGLGGAIITWMDYRRGYADIYAQKINSNGLVQWTTNGIPICVATGNIYLWSPTIISDGSGGAIITWYDNRNGNYDIYVQKIDSSGKVQWTTNGVVICTAKDHQWSPTIISGGSGGAIITWYDNRNGNYDIYAQKINSSGEVQWTTNGISICTAPGVQWYPTIVSDGSGGAIITWEDNRSFNNDIYAQKINSNGMIQWTTNGVAICTSAGGQQEQTIVSDGSGGAIITWRDTRINIYADIYAQKINSNGVVQWISNGVAICTAEGIQWHPTIVSDDSGGAIISWEDYRSPNYDIYAQKINSSGVVQWTTNGVAICTASGNQQEPSIVSNGSNGAIITWQDSRNGYYDIYASQINSKGILPVEVEVNFEIPNIFLLKQNYPNPFNPKTNFDFKISELGLVTFKIYNVIGQEVATLINEELKPGAYKVSWNASGFPSGVYFYTLTFQGNKGNFISTKKMVYLR